MTQGQVPHRASPHPLHLLTPLGDTSALPSGRLIWGPIKVNLWAGNKPGTNKRVT